MAREVIVNPGDDPQFAELAEALAQRHHTPDALAEALRAHYPRAHVSPRLLSGAPEAWYVYREGRWVAGDSRRPE